MPVVVRGDSRNIFESAETPQSLILFLHIFGIRNKEIGGYVALFMDIPSTAQLRLLIADYVTNATRTNGPAAPRS